MGGWGVGCRRVLARLLAKPTATACLASCMAGLGPVPTVAG